MRVGINGMGRMGRLALRAALGGTRRAHLFRRLPQLALREILQLRVRMLLSQSIECGDQLFAVTRSERRRKSAGDDRPVRVAGRHLLSVAA